jgi:hypothetical protein
MFPDLNASIGSVDYVIIVHERIDDPPKVIPSW